MYANVRLRSLFMGNKEPSLPVSCSPQLDLQEAVYLSWTNHDAVRQPTAITKPKLAHVLSADDEFSRRRDNNSSSLSRFFRMLIAAAGNKVVVSVTEVTEFGDFKATLVDSFEASSPALVGGGSGRIEEAFLEVGQGPFRVLVVNEDESAMMVSVDGVDWVREEALAAVDQVKYGLSRLVHMASVQMVGCYVAARHSGRAEGRENAVGFTRKFRVLFFECSPSRSF